MSRGNKVKVTDAFGNQLLRIIVEKSGPILFVCHPNEWEQATIQNREPESIGFRIGDVVNESK